MTEKQKAVIRQLLYKARLTKKTNQHNPYTFDEINHQLVKEVEVMLGDD